MDVILLNSFFKTAMEAHQSKSASVQTQGSDSIAPAYFPCIHFRSDFRFLYILLAPMMHASPCKERNMAQK